MFNHLLVTQFWYSRAPCFVHIGRAVSDYFVAFYRSTTGP